MHSARWVGSVVVAATLGVGLLGGCARSEKKPAPPRIVRVAAASDLSEAFREIARAVEAESGAKVELTFGSSGLLSKQIAEGAPFDVFASANVGFARAAAKSGACDDATQAYARGRLVLYCPSGVPEGGLQGIGRLRKIAIANPEHAPYGVAAMEAWQRLGLARPGGARAENLVFASNVGECLQFARSGNVDCAFVSKALVRGEVPPKVLEVPEELHAPIVQAMVLCSGGATPGDRAAAVAFSEYVRGERGQRVLAAYGFAPAAPPASRAPADSSTD